MWTDLQTAASKVLPSLPLQRFPVDFSGDLPLLPPVGLRWQIPKPEEYFSGGNPVPPRKNPSCPSSLRPLASRGIPSLAEKGRALCAAVCSEITGREMVCKGLAGSYQHSVCCL